MAEPAASSGGGQGREALDDLPAGGVLVVGALVGVAAVALAPLVLGLVAFLAARVLGARWAPSTLLGALGLVGVAIIGPREALETFVAQAPVWRAADGVQADTVGWAVAVAPIALVGGAVMGAALELWWHVSRPFWTQRTTRRSLGARGRARRDRRAMRAGRA
ncbi:MAG: hypothetical protein M3452_07025, partial [Chloroflexota bacterium]|nr:hypothetical protein [Chloroflexota bacterium]